MAATIPPRLSAHGSEARFIFPVAWKKPHITSVVALGYSALGMDLDRSHAETIEVEGRSCVRANIVAIDVEDAYAFDVDEPVELALTYPASMTMQPLVVMWDMNGGEGRGRLEIAPEGGTGFRRQVVTLPRARLAGQGTVHTDIAVGSARSPLVLCDIEVTRTGTTRAPAANGRVMLTVAEAESGAPVPARVGLYDASGRAPLPSKNALLVHRFADEVRMLWASAREFWPSTNRQVFYIDGRYETDVPEGSYELAVTRGSEFRAQRRRIEVRAGETTDIRVTPERYADMAASGWYSGDAHIHLQREGTRDRVVWAQAAAEDLRVANLLQMGNIARTHFDQSGWGLAGRFEQHGRVLVSGQEDPRTGHRGHTIHENLRELIRLAPEHYFEYHRVFEEAKRQGGVSGYAHLAGWFNGRRGLALDVPFGLVDFLEVMQMGRLNLDIWYDFLNLGYRLAPAAGSDYPYIDLPGAVRNYVGIDGPFTTDRWFASFKRGRIFVTNGPLLTFTVNGTPMGDDVHVEAGASLEIIAEARLNPDIDMLDRLELIAHGEVMTVEPARGRDRVVLRTTLRPERSVWLAVRAFGTRHQPRQALAAHSAPIYVIVNGRPFWKASDVPVLVARQRAHLAELMNSPLDPGEDLEAFETRDLLRVMWQTQREALRPRVEEADARYRAILQQAAESVGVVRHRR